MNITVKRIAKRDTYTIGKLYIDGKYYCDTIEDFEFDSDLIYINTIKL